MFKTDTSANITITYTNHGGWTALIIGVITTSVPTAATPMSIYPIMLLNPAATNASTQAIVAVRSVFRVNINEWPKNAIITPTTANHNAQGTNVWSSE